MLQIHRTSLLPFCSRSQSDPTSPKQHSFSVDRTSTIHTVFTMLDTDGCRDSKASSPTTAHPHTTCYARNPRSVGMRKRFVDIFTPSKKRTNTSISTALDISEAPSSTGIPIRFISPRATDSVPASSQCARQRTFSFVHRQTNWKARRSQDTTHLSTQQPTTEQAMPSNNLIPVTELPYHSPMRKDSVASPSSPSKGAALTSHPVSGLDDVLGDESDKFETPISRRSVVFERS
ncbi:hypothetical protein DE146DRAFT_631958 [Phaeosphaeria sp. MPI-PUGE-AT-0046c]|nr:hypothetical protein DE146DRAFT_631958 [Phaeosphaeria sp. MPI-PUGE-AT-0046c]